MRLELVMNECRPVDKLSNQEIQLSLDSAKALIELRPPIKICIILSMYISELLREIYKRLDFEFEEREIPELSDGDIVKAIIHASALRSVSPRFGVQSIMSEYQINLMTEQASRRVAKRNRRARDREIS